MSFACFLTIYCIGLFVLPLAFGIWKYDEVKQFDTDDYFIACFVLAIWPLVACFGTGLALALGILYVISYVFRWPLKAGAKFREFLINRRARKREKAEREHEERVKNAKPGDKEYLDYVCD